MAQSLANYDAALKNVYGPGMRNALNNAHPILTEIPRDTESFSGRKAIWSLHSGRSTASGARAEGAALPTADRQRYIAPEDTLAYLYHTIEVTGQALHLTKNSAGSFASALDQETMGGEQDIKFDLARQMNNEAVTINSTLINGSLAKVNGTPSVNVIIINTNQDATAYSNITRRFFVGEVIDAVTPGSGAISEAGMIITAITAATPSITVDDDGATADNDFLFRTGNFQATATENEINGLPFVIGTQNYAGITAASNDVWNGLTVGSTSEGVSENLLESAIEKVQTDGNGGTPTLGLIEHSQGRKLASIIQQQKRYAPPATKLTAGWTGVEVAGLNLVFDRFVRSDRVYIVTPGDLGWFVGLDWSWDDDDGRILSKKTGYDSITAQYKAYLNLEAYVRNSHVTVTLADPTF